ncbi:MAG: bifunctional biotin--[acetyl-CoA-carboxylase] ligase/biotin operon repressor BirA [Agarilytica sp.]
MLLNEKILAVLGVLADGEFHSGEELGLVLGVTRAAVWKHIQSVESLGLNVSSVRGKGYKVEGGVDLLDQQKIVSKLSEGVQKQLPDIEVVNELESTNQYLLDKLNAKENLASGHVCLAEIQTAGRGRRGRVWQSPFAQNIYFSCVWHFQNGIAGMEGLSLAIGLAVVRALQSLGVEQLSLKWPNDILINNAKLGGVLIEIAGDAGGDCDAVIGVGLNVRMPAAAMKGVDQPWVNLSQVFSGTLARNTIAAEIINHLIVLMGEFEKGGFQTLQKEWEAYSAHLNKHVCLHMPTETVEGKMLGVAGNGALRLEVGGEEKSFIGGEVSLRVSV